jgi:D-glycero-D-manno-heptose 1,7-bisphosphate phosphatase
MRAVFLDRDGVINRKAPEGEYITNWREIEILPGVLEAALDLSRGSYLIFIVTNQRGVATGQIRAADLNEIHQKMIEEFGDVGATVAEIYCCTHDLHLDCLCRKPKPGMLLQAAREHHLNLAHCWIVGDSPSDVEAGFGAGCRTAQIIHPGATEAHGRSAEIKATSLRAAATRILELDR